MKFCYANKSNKSVGNGLLLSRTSYELTSKSLSALYYSTAQFRRFYTLLDFTKSRLNTLTKYIFRLVLYIFVPVYKIQITYINFQPFFIHFIQIFNYIGRVHCGSINLFKPREEAEMKTVQCPFINYINSFTSNKSIQGLNTNISA